MELIIIIHGHSPGHVKGTLNKTKNSLILQISNNGIGMTGEQRHKSDSYGITGMEERARLIGADVKVESSKNQGTKIIVQMPFNSKPI
ncbi:MAG: hypothetical protein KGY60_05635 [Bacteroidales bacterium]|nr:hypothetical protein [Bacteroidales bacterium]